MTTATLLDAPAFRTGERLLDSGGREWRIEEERLDGAGNPVLRVRLRFFGEELSTTFDLPVGEFNDLARRTRMQRWPA
jgi:hypothetical protein